jgi:hypothetical protein
MEQAMKSFPFLSCVLALACACGDGSGHGKVDVRISGQEFAKSGWPSEIDGETVSFSDGWSVRFDRVIVGVEAFRLGDGDDDVVAREPQSALVDVHTGDVEVWQLDDVLARRWDDVGYRFAPPSGETRVLSDIPSELAETMREAGYSLWFSGAAEKGARTIRFELGIPGAVTTSRCLNGRDETFGVVVGEGRTSEVEITLHMDHLFWDDHDAEEPRLLFGPLAYAAGDDGLLTLDELKSQRLTDLRDETGAPLVDAAGIPIVYVPREALPDDNLREYLIDTALTLGHFNGEGHCSYALELAP